MIADSCVGGVLFVKYLFGLLVICFNCVGVYGVVLMYFG